MNSDELDQYRKEIKVFKVKNTIMEDDFSLDDIKFDEIINYPISW
jgi:hypothetical protein